MIAAFVILITLIALLPALTIVDSVLAVGMSSAIVALALVSVGLFLQTNELQRFTKLLTPAALASLFLPCALMFFQILPMPVRQLANPVWSSASLALGTPIVGTVSLDTGAALLSLAHYCAALAAALVAAAVALNRQRAENILLFLSMIAAVIAAGLIGVELGYLSSPGFAQIAERADGVDIAVIGVVLSCATGVQAYEHLDNRNARRQRPQTNPIAVAAISAATLLICLIAVFIAADIILLVAMLFGIGTLAGLLSIRKWRFGPWGQAGMAAAAAIAIVGFFALVPARKDADLTVALSSQTQTASIERMLADTKWLGSGAGSFEIFAAHLPGFPRDRAL